MKLKLTNAIKTYWLPFTLSVFLLIFHATTYFLAKFTPVEAVVVGGKLDDIIPFLPFWVIFYVLWYPLLIFVPCYIYKYDRGKFYTYIIIKFVIDVVSFFIFIFYPTIFNRPELVVNGPFTWVLNIIYMNDTPAMNCLPSMHCTTCFTSIYTIVKSNKIPKKCKVLFSIIFVLIVLSTLFVKQHAIIDVITALILTIIVSFLIYKLKLDNKVEQFFERLKK